jgi:hypothetical protein
MLNMKNIYIGNNVWNSKIGAIKRLLKIFATTKGHWGIACRLERRKSFIFSSFLGWFAEHNHSSCASKAKPTLISVYAILYLCQVLSFWNKRGACPLGKIPKASEDRSMQEGTKVLLVSQSQQAIVFTITLLSSLCIVLFKKACEKAFKVSACRRYCLAMMSIPQ